MLLAITATFARITFTQIGLWSDRHLLYEQIVRTAVHPETRESFGAWEMYLDFIESGGSKGPAGGAGPGPAAGTAGIAANLPSQELRDMAATILREKRSIPPGVPPIAWLHTSLAVRFARSGDLAEADEQYKRALKWAPGYSFALYDRSLLLLQLGRPNEALHEYLWAEASPDPKLPPANRQLFLDLLSRETSSQGNSPLAAAAARRSREIVR